MSAGPASVVLERVCSCFEASERDTAPFIACFRSFRRARIPSSRFNDVAVCTDDVSQSHLVSVFCGRIQCCTRTHARSVPHFPGLENRCGEVVWFLCTGCSAGFVWMYLMAAMQRQKLLVLVGAAYLSHVSGHAARVWLQQQANGCLVLADAKNNFNWLSHIQNWGIHWWYIHCLSFLVHTLGLHLWDLVLASCAHDAHSSRYMTNVVILLRFCFLSAASERM